MDIGKGKWDIGHGMQAKDTWGQCHGKGSWFRMNIGKGKGKYRKQKNVKRKYEKEKGKRGGSEWI